MNDDPVSPRLLTSRRATLKLGAAAALALATRPSSVLAESGPIKIGLSAAYSGPNAQAGQTIQLGADLAIDEINAAGGVLGRPLALVTRDNEHKLDRGVSQARELVEREGCSAILGSQGSFIGIAVIDTMNELQVPWFGTSVGGADKAFWAYDANNLYFALTSPTGGWSGGPTTKTFVTIYIGDGVTGAGATGTTVGLTEEAARGIHGNVDIYRARFRPMKK